MPLYLRCSLEIACSSSHQPLKPFKVSFALPFSPSQVRGRGGSSQRIKNKKAFRSEEERERMGVSIVVIAVILASCLSSACASSAFSSSNVGSQPPPDPRSLPLSLSRLSRPPLPPNRGLSHHLNETQMLLSNVRQTGTAEVIFIVATVVVAHAPTRWKQPRCPRGAFP